MISDENHVRGDDLMYSPEYERYRKEFINCLVWGIPGLGVPFYLAFKEWWPKMQAEKKKSEDRNRR